MPLIEITSLDDPRAEVYRNQKDAWLRVSRGEPGTGLDGGRFIAEGELVVRELLRSPYEVESLLLAPDRVDRLRDALDQVPHLPVLVASPDLMDEIVGFHVHRRVLGCGLVGTPRSPEQVWNEAETLVILEETANHDNTGGIFRNASCLARAPGVLRCPRSCDPLYRKSIRVSMGHVLRVPFAVLEPWPSGLDRVKEAGFEVVAFSPEGAIDLAAWRPERRPALLVGAEGPGLSEEALARADVRVRIPMTPGTDSLNVATATAVGLYHLRSLGIG